LGINSHFNKSEGELLSLNENNINFLKEILNGKFKIEEKVRIEVYLNNILLNEKALNEVYFGARNQFHTSRYVIRVGDKNEEQKSSGVLVVTSTGSKAWYKSAGGKPFRENILKYLVREAFFGRVFNPKLLEGKIRGEIIFISKMCHEGAISIDSNKIYSVFNGDEIKIQLSNENLKVLSI
jgi:NAD kinase